MIENKCCTKCLEIKALENFSVTKRNEDGSVRYRNSWCTDCRVVANRERLGYNKLEKSVVDFDNEMKQCACCKEMFPFKEFPPAKRGSANLSSYCKSCAKEKYYDKEKAKIRTQAYRDANRNRWRTLHRINQFNRRSLIKVTEDGTVTDAFIESIYSEELCYWCKEFTEEDDRTLEHIIELSSGGLHSANNITMACFSCNSARLNKGVKQIESN
jgi:hypothetical protein